MSGKRNLLDQRNVIAANAAHPSAAHDADKNCGAKFNTNAAFRRLWVHSNTKAGVAG